MAAIVSTTALAQSISSRFTNSNMIILPGMNKSYHERRENLPEAALSRAEGRVQAELLATSSQSTNPSMGLHVFRARSRPEK